MLIVNLRQIILNSSTMPHSPESPSAVFTKQSGASLGGFGSTASNVSLGENGLSNVKCRNPLGVGGCSLELLESQLCREMELTCQLVFCSCRRQRLTLAPGEEVPERWAKPGLETQRDEGKTQEAQK